MKALWLVSGLVATALACGPLEERHLDRPNDSGSLDANGVSPSGDNSGRNQKLTNVASGESKVTAATEASPSNGSTANPCAASNQSLSLLGDDDEEENEEEHEEHEAEHEEHEGEHEEHESEHEHAEHEHEHGSTTSTVPQTETTTPAPAPCVTPTAQPTETPVPAGPTWADVEPIVTTNCTRCHNPNGSADFLPLTSETEVRAAAELIIVNVEGGVMPPRNKMFASTPEGQKLLQWLKAK